MRANGSSRAAGGPGWRVEPEASPADGRPVIIVADDDQDILRFIEVNLRAQGHRVVTASDGDQCLGLALEHRPALVLLDVVLPGVDGFEICRRLRSDWRFGDPSVILLTGRSLPADRTLGLAAGADDFIVKPFDPVELVSRVNLTLQRLEQVRSASPLTGLPGNVHIERELEMRVAADEDVALLYVDLDDFKAYNDHYGFLQGDEAIRALADVLRQAAEVRPDTFLGHVGGDDFIALVQPDVVEGFVEDVIGGFEARVESLYDPDDAERGYVEIEDRRGRKRRFGLLTLSIGVATNLGRQVEDHRVLVDIATEMKEYAKRRRGNAVAVDRRAGGELAARLVGLSPVGPRRRPPRHRRLVRGYLVSATVALLALGFLVLPATLVLAENSLPGEPLWRVKLSVEQIRLAVESDPAREVSLHLEFAARRVAELGPVVATEANEARVAEVAADLTRHTEAALAWIGAIEDGDRAVLVRTQAANALGQQADVLGALVSGRCQGVAEPAGCGWLRRALDESALALDRVRAELGLPTGQGGQGLEAAPGPNAASDPPAEDGKEKENPKGTGKAKGGGDGRSRGQAGEVGSPEGEPPPVGGRSLARRSGKG